MRAPTPASDRARALGLGSRHPEERAEAELAIRAMGPEAIPFLTIVLDEQRLVCKRRKHLTLSIALTAMVGYVLFNVLVLLHSLVPELVPALPYALLLLGYVSIASLYFRTTRLLENVGSLLLAMADKNQIGELIVLLEYAEMERARAVKVALTPLLAQLQASDAESLTVVHRKILAAHLNHLPGNGQEEAAAFTIALLQALQQVGDGSFVEPVRRMTFLDAFGIGKQVQAVARETLPYLEAFAEREQKSGTLMRAAIAPEDDSARSRLLRAARTDLHPDAQTLLVRPSEEEDRE